MAADTLGGPVDTLAFLLNGPPQLVNWFFGTDIPLIENPIGGGDYMYDRITDLMEGAGITVRDPDTMTPGERQIFDFGRILVGPLTPWSIPSTENPFDDWR